MIGISFDYTSINLLKHHHPKIWNNQEGMNSGKTWGQCFKCNFYAKIKKLPWFLLEFKKLSTKEIKLY